MCYAKIICWFVCFPVKSGIIRPSVCLSVRRPSYLYTHTHTHTLTHTRLHTHTDLRQEYYGFEPGLLDKFDSTKISPKKKKIVAKLDGTFGFLSVPYLSINIFA